MIKNENNLIDTIELMFTEFQSLPFDEKTLHGIARVHARTIVRHVEKRIHEDSIVIDKAEIVHPDADISDKDLEVIIKEVGRQVASARLDKLAGDNEK